MFGHMNEPFTMSRDVKAVIIPAGEELLLREGTNGFITQALGGSFTIYVEGNLFRIAGADADAIGKEAPPPVTYPERAPGDPIDPDVVWSALSACYDPEIPVNIVELGLVYAVRMFKTGDDDHRVEIDMTLTAPGCGMGQVLADDVRYSLEAVPGITEVAVELVFDPPWTPEHMSEAARLELNMF